MTDQRTGATAALKHVVYVVLFGAIALHPRPAAAEKVLGNVGGWEIYTDGRAAGFLSFAYGDGYPQPDYGHDLNGNFVTTPVDTPQEGGRLGWQRRIEFVLVNVVRAGPHRLTARPFG